MEKELPMSDADIIREYREAKDQYAQITILADLNITTRKHIEAILQSAGIPLPRKTCASAKCYSHNIRWTNEMRLAIFDMHDHGMTFREIAGHYNCNPQSIINILKRKNPRTEHHHRPGKKKNET
nr:MAG TPA: putative DNA invertase [Caudoviricetes sp.]